MDRGAWWATVQSWTWLSDFHWGPHLWNRRDRSRGGQRGWAGRTPAEASASPTAGFGTEMAIWNCTEVGAKCPTLTNLGCGCSRKGGDPGQQCFLQPWGGCQLRPTASNSPSCWGSKSFIPKRGGHSILGARNFTSLLNQEYAHQKSGVSVPAPVTVSGPNGRVSCWLNLDSTVLHAKWNSMEWWGKEFENLVL